MHRRQQIRSKRLQYKWLQRFIAQGGQADPGLMKGLAKEIRELSRAERDNGHWKPKAKKGVPVAGQAAGVNANGVAQGLDSYAVNLARDLYCWGFCPQCEKPTEAVGTFQEDQWLRFYHTGSGWDDNAHHLIKIGTQAQGNMLLEEARKIANHYLGSLTAKALHDQRWATSIAAQPYKPPPQMPELGGWGGLANAKPYWQGAQQGISMTTYSGVMLQSGGAGGGAGWVGPGVIGNDVLLGNEMQQAWIPQPQTYPQTAKAAPKPKAKLRIAEIGRKRVVDFDAD